MVPKESLHKKMKTLPEQNIDISDADYCLCDENKTKLTGNGQKSN